MKKIKNETILEQYFKAAETERRAKKDKDKLKAEVLKLLGKDKQGLSDRYSVELATITQQRFDTKGFEQAHPAEYLRYLVSSSYDRLTVKER